jgi:hypothetical protein
MKTAKKIITVTILSAWILALWGCQTDQAKTRLDPPEMVDDGDEKTDYISFFTDVVGEFRTYGETIEGDFLPRGFVGYKFTGKGSEVVTIEATALTYNRDTVLFLYPPIAEDDFWAEVWREPVAENDDINYPYNTNSAIVDFTLPRDGVYLIVVAEYFGRGGSYSLTLSCTGGGCLDQPSMCGGIAGFPCPEGQWCKLDGDYPDAAGHCMDARSCEESNDCVLQQTMGLLPTDMPCPDGGWAYYTCNSGTCTPECPVVEPQTRCERLGGYCTYFLTECEDGFTGANEPGEFLECDGGRSAKCCVPADPNPYACGSDDDCVRVNAACCGCEMGGRSVAVNRNVADLATPDPSTCMDIMCSAVYTCIGEPACVDGLCALVDRPTPQAGCVASGGTLGTASCCLSTGDFPNTCMIGPCGCSPTNSHEVQMCFCPEGQCFDGTACVAL